MRDGWHSDRDGIHMAEDFPKGKNSARAVFFRNCLRSPDIDVDYRREFNVRQVGEYSRVIPAMLADTNHGNSKGISQLVTPVRGGALFYVNPACRPTMTMPASSAALMIASPSIISVFPASTDSTVAPAAFIASMVDTPTTGTSNRMS